VIAIIARGANNPQADFDVVVDIFAERRGPEANRMFELGQ
jgi:hypothetical protein